LRTVAWRRRPLEPDELAHLEIETKTGLVVVIDHASGEVYANPPMPPGATAQRQQHDLTRELASAFDGRPAFEKISPVFDQGQLSAWRFELSTGAAFSFVLNDRQLLITAGVSRLP